MTAPLNFPDVVFWNDLDLYAREITSDYQGLRQDVYHLEQQAIGSNLDDVSKGLDVDGCLSGSAGELQTLAAEADEQLAQDDRIASSKASLVQHEDGSWSLVIQMQPVASILPPSANPNLSVSYP